MTTKSKIQLGLWISIGIIILNSFILIDIPEIISRGAAIGVILTNLCLAYISSYAFYVIVYVSREKEVKKTIHKPIKKSTEKIIFHGLYIIDVLAADEKIGRAAIHEKRKSISESEYKSLCTLINPNSNSAFSIQVSDLELKTQTKIEALHTQCIVLVKKHIEKALLFLPYLEDEYLEILNEILDSQFHSFDKTLFFARTNTNFKVYQNYMYEYLKLILKLEAYYNKSIAQHHYEK